MIFKIIISLKLIRNIDFIKYLVTWGFLLLSVNDFLRFFIQCVYLLTLCIYMFQKVEKKNNSKIKKINQYPQPLYNRITVQGKKKKTFQYYI